MDALSERNPREATADVLDGAVKLLRAQLKLLGYYARGVAKRAGFSIALAWLATSFVQLALVLIVLSPVLVGVSPWHAVVWTILLALAVAMLVSGCGGGSSTLSDEQFQSGLQASIEAASKGQELMKDARPKRGTRRGS